MTAPAPSPREPQEPESGPPKKVVEHPRLLIVGLLCICAGLIGAICTFVTHSFQEGAIEEIMFHLPFVCMPLGVLFLLGALVDSIYRFLRFFSRGWPAGILTFLVGLVLVSPGLSFFGERYTFVHFLIQLAIISVLILVSVMVARRRGA